MSGWKRYQRARKRKGFQGTMLKKTQGSECRVPGICERKGCTDKATHSIYGLGYVASVCQKHYEAATYDERQNAVRFKYAER